jgi:tetratricopeptide (TPR) repeat protein
MLSSASESPAAHATEVLASVDELYRRSRFVDAHAAGRPLGDLRAWPGVEGAILASRLAERLGAPRLSQAIRRATLSRAPTHPEALYFWALQLNGRRGPWHLLRWMAPRAVHVVGSARHADWLALEAIALAHLRDFDRALARMTEALALAPRSPWLHVEHAGVLERADRIEDALLAVDGALTIEPSYRPAMHARAHVLGELGRTEEAHASLGEVDRLQSYELLLHRAQLARQLHRFEACAADVARARELASLAEPSVRSSLALAEADALYLLGRPAEAERAARSGRGDFATRFADALAELARTGAAPERVELRDVPHIRQHHQTCAPASLAQVTAYLGDPVDHLELAATICFAGTPAHRQRAWAEARGYRVRELDLSVEAAKALVDAGLPFVLSTAATASAHAQVVIGYDLTRRGLLIRDPSLHGDVEMNLDALLALQRWWGPHAMVLIPPSKLGVIDDAILPNADLLDHRYALDRAMDAHDAAGVDAALDALTRAANVDDALASTLAGIAPTDESIVRRVRHVLDARFVVAAHRDRAVEQLAALDGLLTLFPETPSWLLRRGELLRALRSRAERLEFWHAHRHVDDPVFLEAIAEELRFDPERRDEAGRLLRRALRIAPYSGMAHHVYADWLTQEAPDPEAALESYRFAVCLDDASEHFAAAYYDHARSLGREDEALALLERRARAAGSVALGPALTLLRAYVDRGQPERGVALLERLAEARPDDGTLTSSLATACLDAGDVAAARRWIERGAGLRGHEPTRASAEARVAVAEGRLDAAAEVLRRARELAPDRVELIAHEASVARALGGPTAGLEVLENAYAARPELPGLVIELCTHLRGVDEKRAREVLEDRLARHPDDAWSRRELALVLDALGLRDEAIVLSRETVARWPHESYGWSILGSLLAATGEASEARSALRRAIDLDVDNVPAIVELGRCGGTPEDTRQDSRFVLDALARRTSAGPGLLEGARLAEVLPVAERTERLEHLLARAGHRPDAWEALARARFVAGDLDGAATMIEDACARFPRWISLLHLRGVIARGRGDDAGAEAALRHTLELAPGHTPSTILLARIACLAGRFDEALATLDAAIARAPQDAALHVERAEVLAARGDRGAALEVLLARLRDVDDRAFDHACAWASELDRADELFAAARALAERERGAWASLRLAVAAGALGRTEERLVALRAAVARDPRHEPALDLLAEELALRGSFDEALAHCPPTTWKGPTPVPMRGRRAWIRYQRGETTEAFAEMEQLLVDDPTYEWGRRQLCDWLDHAQRHAEFLRHARLLAEHVPRSPSSHAYLGDALLRAGDVAGAHASFVRAWSIDPAFLYAAHRVVTEGDPDEAARLLARSEHALPPADAAALGVRLALRRDDPSVLARLDALLALRAPSSMLQPLFVALLGSPFADEATRIVEDALCREETSEEVGFAWSAASDDARPKRALGSLLRRRDRLARAGLAAAATAIEQLAHRAGTFAIFWLWLRHRAWLASHDTTWGALGYALFTRGWYRLTTWWLGDWARRTHATPVQLVNLVMAHFALGQPGRARTISTHVRTIPSDGSRGLHVAYDALGCALAQEYDEATRLLEGAKPVDRWSAAVLAMARMIVTAHAKAHLDVEAVASAVRWSFQTAVDFANDAMLGEAYKKAFAATLMTRPLAERGALARTLTGAS